MRDTRDVRATGLQGEESSEIIEIIDDDVDAFSSRTPNVTVHDTGGPRWAGPAAAVALVALIGYGVATSASSGAPKAAPAPSTTTPRTTTTQPAPTTTVPPPLVPYYSADPPREFSVSAADRYDADRSFFGPGKYQLWATTGATSSTGSWFSIETYPGSTMAVDAYRVETVDRSIGVSHSPSGQSRAQFSSTAAGSVAITSFGMSDEDLIRLAGSVLVSRGSIRLPDPSPVPGYDLVSSVQPWLAVQGVPVETVVYQSNQAAPFRPDGVINLSVAPRSPSNQGGSTLERQTAIRFFLDHTTTFDVDGHVAVAGTVVGQDDYSLASWIAGDHIVTVSGALTVPELIAVARTVHQVSIDEWQGMQFQATKHNADNNFGGFEADSVAVSFGTDSESNPWVIKVSVLSFSPNEPGIGWHWDKNHGGFNGQYPTSADETAKITTVVEDRRTYVLADLPRAVAPTARLEVTRAGLDPVEVTFNDISPDWDRTFAAYAFSEPTTYTAQIIGEDGRVLASWPRP